MPGSNVRALELANAAFQQMKASVLPKSVYDFYMSFGCAILGDAYVFPVEEISRTARNYTIPSIVKINREFSGIQILRGKTVWGRNQMYIFSCDVIGFLYMHDVLTLQVLRKYDNLDAALTDCLLIGKI